jgi:hypothetical protein
MPRWLIATLLTLCALLWWVAHRNSAPLAATAGGTGAADACRVLQVPGPILEAVQTQQSAAPFRLGDATLTPLAAFSVGGRILSREDYHFGREANYSPTDLALGWGPMAAPGMAERLQVSQGGRFYRYRWDAGNAPLAPADIVLNSSNMHMVPANEAAANALAGLSAGQLVRLDGWLLEIDADDGWHWRSSLSRGDTGNGACELVLVCQVRTR